MSENYQVVVFNDEEHSYQYVVEVLSGILGVSHEYAFRLSQAIDTTVRTTVFIGARVDADAVRAAIVEAGRDALVESSTAPLRVVVETWDGEPLPGDEPGRVPPSWLIWLAAASAILLIFALLAL